MKSRGGTLIGAGSLDAPVFVARTWAGGRGQSVRVRPVLAAGCVGALWRRGAARRRAAERASSLAIFIWPCRAIRHGATGPATSTVSLFGRHHVKIDAAKNVSLKKQTLLDLKLVLKKC